MFKHVSKSTLGAIVLSAGVPGFHAAPARGDAIRVTIQNENDSEGFFFTPFWLAAHDGTFDMYDRGSFAQPSWPGITEIAENGNFGPMDARFASSGAGLAGGRTTIVTANMIGPPPFNPGEAASIIFDIGDPTVNRYFSYASMVIPSNDLYVANDNPMAHEMFDASGQFRGPMEIFIFGRHVNDNGTEVNNAYGDAAFSLNGGQAMPEYNEIRAFFTQPGDVEYLESFLGTMTASGDTITSIFGADDLIATIRIEQVPAPASAAMLLMSGLTVFGRRRRRTS